ncbi:hypothetical protein GH714_014335 [Hevea brasiliensis]|uniref:Retrotransposon gag domain-containing protein n=1 Tax=Hevea brasiliensis TaxID=3981 RepID=A0A6A6L9N1_HEVBR|nr:hypothetical protein GH714_014335 [Hevea brasiliensis]
MITKELQLQGHQRAAESSTTIVIKSSQIIADGSIPFNQLKDLIKEAIKDQFDGITQPSYSYVKPYSPKIDLMKMPVNYQPIKFQQFDGKGNPRQHVAHFVETCNNAGTEGDLMAKQFVRSLKGNAFDLGLQCILQGVKPKAFEELATRAHDMELSIAVVGSQALPI